MACVEIPVRYVALLSDMVAKTHKLNCKSCSYHDHVTAVVVSDALMGTQVCRWPLCSHVDCYGRRSSAFWCH